MKSIQSKILFVVITGLMIITAVVSAIGVSMTHEVMHRDADRILKNATQREAAKINDTLGDVMKSSSIMEHYAVDMLTNINALKDAGYRRQYIESVDAMFHEVALNTNSIMGYYLRLDPSCSDGSSGFYKMVSSDGRLVSMPLTDLTRYEKDDKQNVGWYYEAALAGEGVWLEPYCFPSTTNRMITYAVPLYLDGSLFGVIGFDMDFDYLVRRIAEISVYEGGQAVLLAKDGETAYNEVTIEEEHEHGHDDPHAQTKEELKNGMYLELRADYKDIQKDIRPMLSKIVQAFLVVLAAAIVYTIFVTRKIVGPLKRLTQAAQAIALGNDEAEIREIEVDSDDEIGTLARVLGGAYAKIQEYTAYINALAHRDALTGVKNTTSYAEATQELNKKICTGNPKFGVLMADINNLKQTNDQFGHAAGDELIVGCAKVLVDTFKSSVIFRIGGDEFAVILQDEDYKHYHERLRKLDAACAETNVIVEDAVIPVSMAVGVSLFDPDIDRVYEDVFAKADHTMYLNKEEMKTAGAK